MTKKEMEMHIKSLEENLSALAKKVYDRDSANEGKIDKVDITVSEQGVTIAENKDAADEHEAQLLYQICLLQLGLDDSDFDFDLEDDEEVEE